MLRVYHGARDPAHRERERALQTAGVEVVLVVPARWEGDGVEPHLSTEAFRVIELPVARPGDVNRHRYSSDQAALEGIIREVNPDVIDLHEEPFSIVARQWLAASPRGTPVVIYTAQNIDKRYPPPFSWYERSAYRRASALYPCTSQAASVARGKGFSGAIEVLALGHADAVLSPGQQSVDDTELVLALSGRLVPEKGIRDAVQILARVHAVRPARLVIVGRGPEETAARHLAADLGVAERLELVGWQQAHALAETLRRAHFVLVPSKPTDTWVEQFGRVIVEAQASGAVVAGYASGAIEEVAGEAGLLVHVGAVKDLAEGITRLIADPTEFARRREQGMRLSRTRTWRHVAERQADLYRRAASVSVQRLELPRSPKERRSAARDEFGAPASTLAGARPFALPFLRGGGAPSRVLAGALDAVAELLVRLDLRQRRPVGRRG